MRRQRHQAVKEHDPDKMVGEGKSAYLPSCPRFQYPLLQSYTHKALPLLKTNTLFQQDKRRLYTWTSPDGQN